MKTNILQTLLNLDKIRENKVGKIYKSHNSINNNGVALEYYLKDLFCNSYDIEEVADKDKEHSKYLSYLGNQNNPPDFIIENSDAVEVKKVESQGSRVALNSSYPKHKLHSDDSRITKECKNCEDEVWDEKDIIYVIGTVKSSKLRLLWLVYGDCYAASQDTYLDKFNDVKEGVKRSFEVNGYTVNETNELGKMKKMDPLGITDFRVRGMFHINNPLSVYDYLGVNYNDSRDLTVYTIMREDKYNSFPKKDKEQLEKLSDQKSSPIEIKDVEIKDPNNPANYLQAKLIEGMYNDL